MITSKHISKIVAAFTALAVTFCLLGMVFSDRLAEAFGGTSVKMDYESTLFDTSEIISVDIIMDQEEWDKMLANATAEEYYSCDAVINGETFKSVGIRPKGNTSLSSIAMNPDTDRYSLKLEFGHFVKGQTCHGLDKLILNNNYADATNMKEAIIYDMFQFLGADASLYNYAKVSVNGEYFGVYLALEAVEQSFMLRNFGARNGDLYKPDSMEMGGGNKDSESAAPGRDFNPGSMPEGMEGFDPNNMPEGMEGFDPNNMPESMEGFEGFTPDSIPGGNDDSGSFNPGNMPWGSGSSDSDDSSSGFGGFNPGSIPSGDGDSGSFNPGSMPGNREDFTSRSDRNTDSDDSSDRSGRGKRPDSEAGSSDRDSRGSFGGFGGGFSRGGGSDLNYTDDELDSYSTIWNSAITQVNKADKRRVVTALKNISEGTDLEKYMDVDNILKYMAVHTFSVNMDSLSGNMAHNYYLYEYNGKLNILPWDYNLCLGGMSMGSSGNASDTINDAIDTPFSATHFFDALLENEEYLAKYHEYLQQLVDEYVGGGRFEETYNRIRNNIDSLVETDPTAFYTYDEYQPAAEMLYQTVLLRAESISGQLDGTIPSTDEGQRKDSSTLVDSSSIDLKVMGEFNMGGNFGSFKVRGDRKKDKE